MYGTLPSSNSHSSIAVSETEHLADEERTSRGYFSVYKVSAAVLSLLLVTSILAFNGTTLNVRTGQTATTASVSSEFAASTVLSSEKSSQTKPNFVYLLIDDLPWNAIGYNDFDFKSLTPNIDRHAKSHGIIVENYYAQELCTPSRASLLTGRYPASIARQFDEIEVNSVLGLRLSEKLLPEVLREHGGYKNYMLGKWNLGNSDPRYLPTMRGFDEFLGYLGGGINPYGKSATLDDGDKYIDFMYADSECYNIYTQPDFSNYTTYIFRDKAIEAINAHDFDDAPMFLYVAFHGVHSPLGEGKLQITGDDVGQEVYKEIKGAVKTEGRQKIAAVMNLIDSSMQKIYEALEARGQSSNTYFILSSDNGGCNDSGGFNGPLRGSKGSLWEGGTRVDAMIFGDLIPEKARGTRYKGLMHTSDWFPTMLELAGIASQYHPDASHALDGVNQATAMFDGRTSDFPRKTMLYNVYSRVSYMNFDLDSYTSAAVRNERYKLIHTFEDSELANWYEYDTGSTKLNGKCDPWNVLTGSVFMKHLFDLVEDPYEKNNLYDVAEYSQIQDELTAMLVEYAQNAEMVDVSGVMERADKYFMNNGGFAQPFLSTSGKYSLLKCEKETLFNK